MKKIVFAIVAFSFFLVGCGGKSLPECNGSDTQNNLGNIINDMPIVKMVGAKFVTVKNVEELGFNEKTQLRSCKAVLVTTLGEDQLQYSISWQNREEGMFYVEAMIQ